jgi:hypothetical protein
MMIYNQIFKLAREGEYELLDRQRHDLRLFAFLPRVRLAAKPKKREYSY